MKIHSTTVSQKRMKMIKPQSVPLIFDGNTIITVIVFVAFYDKRKPYTPAQRDIHRYRNHLRDTCRDNNGILPKCFRVLI